MTTTPERSHKCDKLFKPFQGIIRSLSPLPGRLFEGTFVTESNTSALSSEPHLSNAVPLTPDSTLASQPVATPVSPQRLFIRSQSFEEDIALLHASFISSIRNSDKEDK